MRYATLLEALKETRRPVRKPWVPLEVLGTFSLRACKPGLVRLIKGPRKDKGRTRMVGERAAKRRESEAWEHSERCGEVGSGGGKWVER